MHDSRPWLSPAAILIGRTFYALCVQFFNEPVEATLPHSLEPYGVTEPFHNGGAYCIIGSNEGATQEGFSQGIVPEATECPNLGAVIRTVDASGYIAALTVTVIIAAEHSRIAGTSGFAFCIAMIIATEEAGI